MAAFRIPVGGEDFDVIRQKGSYYVDKSGLIYDLVNGTENTVTLFTRPRRFGKTLNMSMIGSFFDITRDSRAVFEGLEVSRHAFGRGTGGTAGEEKGGADAIAREPSYFRSPTPPFAC